MVVVPCPTGKPADGTPLGRAFPLGDAEGDVAFALGRGNGSRGALGLQAPDFMAVPEGEADGVPEGETDGVPEGLTTLDGTTVPDGIAEPAGEDPTIVEMGEPASTDAPEDMPPVLMPIVDITPPLCLTGTLTGTPVPVIDA